jgi:hypothetical protein
MRLKAHLLWYQSCTPEGVPRYEPEAALVRPHLQYRFQETFFKLSVVTESLIQNFGGLFGGAAYFGNLPFHFAGADFVLRDTAGFAGIGLNHRRSSGLELAGAPRGDQNVSIIAIEAFDQLHGFSPWYRVQVSIAESWNASFFASEG